MVVTFHEVFLERYTWSAGSGTNLLNPYRCAFFFFGFTFILFFRALFRKIIYIAVVGNVQGNIFLKTFSESHLFGRFGLFSDAKVKFFGSQILVKTPKNTFFSFKLINFPFWSIFHLLITWLIWCAKYFLHICLVWGHLKKLRSMLKDYNSWNSEFKFIG